jgi:hypothetical protein
MARGAPGVEPRAIAEIRTDYASVKRIRVGQSSIEQTPAARRSCGPRGRGLNIGGRLRQGWGGGQPEADEQRQRLDGNYLHRARGAQGRDRSDSRRLAIRGLPMLIRIWRQEGRDRDFCDQRHRNPVALHRRAVI